MYSLRRLDKKIYERPRLRDPDGVELLIREYGCRRPFPLAPTCTKGPITQGWEPIAKTG